MKGYIEESKINKWKSIEGLADIQSHELLISQRL